MMKPLLVTLLISSMLLPATANAAGGAGPPLALDKAPVVDPWPKNLPKATMLNGLACLPLPLAQATHERLLFLDKFPALCQGAMDSHARFLDAQCTNQRAADGAHALADCAEKTRSLEEHQWKWYEIGGLVLGSIAVGFVVGEVAHH